MVSYISPFFAIVEGAVLFGDWTGQSVLGILLELVGGVYVCMCVCGVCVCGVYVCVCVCVCVCVLGESRNAGLKSLKGLSFFFFHLAISEGHLELSPSKRILGHPGITITKRSRVQEQLAVCVCLCVCEY